MGTTVLVVVIAAILSVAGCAAATPPGAMPGPGVGREPAADRGDRWAEVRAAGAGTIRVLYVPAEGFAYRDAQGRLTGVTVEIVHAFLEWVATTHGVRLGADFVGEPDWRTFYARVRDAEGGVFGLGNVTITAARREELQFSPPYLTNVAVLITRADVPELRSVRELADTFRGLSALAFQGTLHEQRLRRLRQEHAPALPLALAGSNDEILERVAGGGYFAYIDGYNYWRAEAAGAPLRRHPVGDDPAEEFGIILPLQSDWAPLLEEFFARNGGFRATALYRQLLVEHLGQPVAEALEAARRRSTDRSPP